MLRADALDFLVGLLHLESVVVDEGFNGAAVVGADEGGQVGQTLNLINH